MCSNIICESIMNNGGSFCVRFRDKEDINDEDIRTWINFIISPEMMKIGDKYLLLEMHAELIKKDWFMTLIDVKDYVATKERMFADYEDRMQWAKKMVINISQAGYFSADRTIAQYDQDIWHVNS